MGNQMEISTDLLSLYCSERCFDMGNSFKSPRLDESINNNLFCGNCDYLVFENA